MCSMVPELLHTDRRSDRYGETDGHIFATFRYERARTHLKSVVCSSQYNATVCTWKENKPSLVGCR
jgi:hypothetical protein